MGRGGGGGTKGGCYFDPNIPSKALGGPIFYPKIEETSDGRGYQCKKKDSGG